MAKFDSPAVARRQRSNLALIAAVPDGTDGMNNMSRWQPIRFGDFSVAGNAATERAAFGQQFRPCRAMYGAIDAAAAKQPGIYGVDDGVNAQRRDVGDDNFQPCRADAVFQAIRRTPPR